MQLFGMPHAQPLISASAMASRKDQKEQARAARLAAEQAAQERAARTRRVQLLGGTLVIAIAAIVVIVVISVGGGGNGGGIKSNKKQSAALYNQVNGLLAGIPESGATLGKPSAPVTVTYYGDLQCPFCATFTLDALPQFIQTDVRPGKAKLVYRAFCTATCHLSNGQSIFNDQQVAALAAGKQNLFWYYTELFYHQQGAENSGYMTPTFLNDLAAQIPSLKTSKWQTDRKDPSLLGQVQQDAQIGTSQNVSGTPTVIFKGPKGEEVAPNSIIGPGGYSSMASTMKAVS
jgi:protein-disulfide isomerase